MKAPRSKHQDPEKIQTSNTNGWRPAGCENEWSLELGAFLALGVWRLELF
jgi:hypothetical protein